MKGGAGGPGGIYGHCLCMRRPGKRKQDPLNWIWWGVWRATRPSARTSPAKERPQRICKHSDGWVSWSCVREQQTGQGTQCLLHLGLKAWLSSRNPRCLRPVWKFQSKEDLPSVEEGWIRDYINTWTYMSPWDWWDTLTWWIEVTFISMPGKVR